jgi:hypothetical protein
MPREFKTRSRIAVGYRVVIDETEELQLTFE